LSPLKWESACGGRIFCCLQAPTHQTLPGLPISDRQTSVCIQIWYRFNQKHLRKREDNKCHFPGLRAAFSPGLSLTGSLGMTVNTRASITAPLPWAVFEKPPAFIPADINISLMLFILSYLFCQYAKIIFIKPLTSLSTSVF